MVTRWCMPQSIWGASMGGEWLLVVHLALYRQPVSLLKGSSQHLPIFCKARWNPVLCFGQPLLLTQRDGSTWVTGGSEGPALGPQGLGCPSLCCAQWAEWQALNENGCSRRQSNKSNPIYSLPWDVAVSWKVHLWRFPGLVTFPAISLAYSSKAQVFIKREIEIIKEKNTN